MKITIDGRCLAASVGTSQAARYTQTLITRLAQRGFSPHVAYSAIDPVPSERLGCSAVPSPLEGRGWLWEHVSLPRFLQTGKFELLHIPSQTARAPLWSPCPVLMTVHGGHFDSAVATTSSSRTPGLVHRARVQHTILAQSFCEPSLKAHPVDMTVGTFVEEDDCRGGPDLTGLPIREPYLLAVDYGETKTDLKPLLTAFQQVRVAFPALQLVMVCQVIPPVKILESVTKCGLLIDDDILFVSNSAGLVPKLADAAELAIALGAPGECQWVVPAMASGLEFVCSARGCAARVVGPAGRVVDRPEPAEIAGSIAALLRSGDRRQRAGIAQRQARRFEWTGIVDGTLGVYTALIGEGTGRPRQPIGQDPLADQIR